MDWGGESDHNPILLEIKGGSHRPPSPFKFNVAWVADPGYIELMKSLWRSLGQGDDIREGVAFMENLKNLKKEMIFWSTERKVVEDAELVGIEKWIADGFSSDGDGFGMEEQKRILILKEKQWKEILVDREALWHLKRRAIWLASGDENTKFFHAYVKGRKVQNTIWEMQDDRG